VTEVVPQESKKRLNAASLPTKNLRSSVKDHLIPKEISRQAPVETDPKIGILLPGTGLQLGRSGQGTGHLEVTGPNLQLERINLEGPVTEETSILVTGTIGAKRILGIERMTDAEKIRVPLGLRTGGGRIRVYVVLRISLG